MSTFEFVVTAIGVLYLLWNEYRWNRMEKWADFTHSAVRYGMENFKVIGKFMVDAGAPVGVVRENPETGEVTELSPEDKGRLH